MRFIKDILRLKLEVRRSHQQIANSLDISKAVVTKYVNCHATTWPGKSCACEQPLISGSTP